MSNNLDISSWLLKSNRSDPYLICQSSALSVPACIFFFFFLDNCIYILN